MEEQLVPDDHIDSAGHRLTFEEHDRYFFACVEGPLNTHKEIEEYQQRFAQEIRVRNYDRVLLKRDGPDGGEPAELYAVPKMVGGYRDIRYALVDLNSSRRKGYKLALLSAKSQGLALKTFPDISSAKAWLLE